MGWLTVIKVIFGAFGATFAILFAYYIFVMTVEYIDSRWGR